MKIHTDLNKIKVLSLVVLSMLALVCRGEEPKVIEITANDQMKFSVTKISAHPGETLRIVLKNIGTMPKLSMGHDLVVLVPGTNLMDFAMEAAQAATTDYIPAKYKSSVLASTKLLGPGESDTLTLTVPDKAGKIYYICSFPGHMQVGMKGVITVK